MPGMDGITLFLNQLGVGCKVDIRNRAIMSGDLGEEKAEVLDRLGVPHFRKPLDFSSLTAWTEECERRIDPSQPLYTRRRHFRTTFNSEVEYTASNAGDKDSRGLVVNVSEKGLCMKIKQRLDRHQIIRISTELPIDCKTASVRWIKPAKNNSYTVGLYCAAGK